MIINRKIKIFILICIFGVISLNWINISPPRNNSPVSTKNNPKFPNPNAAPPDLNEWNLTWGISSANYGQDLILDSDENLYIVGDTDTFGAEGFDFFITKFDQYGNYNWHRTWGRTRYEHCYAVTCDSQNDLILAGYSDVTTAYLIDNDVCIVKYNSEGNLLWVKLWGFPSTHEEAYDIEVDSMDNIYIVGRISRSNDLLIVKFDESGNYIWNKTIGGPLIDLAHCIEIDSSDDLYVGGYVGASAAGGGNLYLAKFDSSGAELWNKTWGVGRTRDIKIDDLGNIYATGYTSSGFYLCKLDNLGNEIWSRTRGGVSPDLTFGGGYSIGFDSWGKIYVGGQVLHQDDGSTWRFQDFFLAKYSSSGELLWNKTWYGHKIDYCRKVVINSKDNIFLGGETRSFAAGVADAFIIKCRSPINVKIMSPYSGDIFGKDSIDFEISVQQDDPVVNKSWYTLNNGIKGFFAGNSGEIEQLIWDGCGNGSVELKFVVNDTWGYEYSSKVFLHKDILPPNITTLNPSENQLFGTDSPSYEISIQEGNLASIWYSLNNFKNYSITNSSGNIDPHGWSLCANGTVAIKFFANDSLGNLGFKDIVVTKDIIKPNITILKPLPYELFGVNPLEIEISVDEGNLDSIWYSLNGGENYTYSSLINTINQSAWDACENGSVNLRFYANDTLGNLGSAEVNILKDDSIPIITLFEPFPNQIYGHNPPFFNISVIDTDLNTTWYSVNNGENIIFSNTSGSIDQVAWNACGNGTVLLKFFANDTGGNVGLSEVLIRKNIEAPIINFAFSSAFLETTTPEYFHSGLSVNCSIIGNTDISWVYLCENSTGSFFNQSMTDLGSGNWFFNLDISSLEWGDQILFSFYANDTVGNIGKKNNNSNLYKLKINDYQNPISAIYYIPHDSPNIIIYSTSFTITANDIGSGISLIRYRIDNSNWIQYTQSFNFSAYSPGSYDISYYSIDNAGNVEEIKSIIVVLVSAEESTPQATIPSFNLGILFTLILVITLIISYRKKNDNF